MTSADDGRITLGASSEEIEHWMEYLCESLRQSEYSRDYLAVAVTRSLMWRTFAGTVHSLIDGIFRLRRRRRRDSMHPRGWGYLRMWVINKVFRRITSA